MDQPTAQRRLRRMVAADSVPALDVEELADLLAIAKRPAPDGALPTNIEADTDEWAPATYYAAQTVIRSQLTNGSWRYWRAASGGVSHPTTKPGFPDLRAYRRTDYIIRDLGLFWEDVGGLWTPTWDLNRAAAEGWETKAAKVAGSVDVLLDGQQISRSQLQAQCLEQADRYRKRANTSVDVSSDQLDEASPVWR